MWDLYAAISRLARRRVLCLRPARPKLDAGCRSYVCDPYIRQLARSAQTKQIVRLSRTSRGDMAMLEKWEAGGLEVENARMGNRIRPLHYNDNPRDRPNASDGGRRLYVLGKNWFLCFPRSNRGRHLVF